MDLKNGLRQKIKQLKITLR